ncbi:MAG: zinc ABC transporter substrate-binding protein [Deltaproteobacteria bacterium]|nr:zinc ABC transporter substrate-binding protein [Deltaproteobacteria bacterium]
MIFRILLWVVVFMAVATPVVAKVNVVATLPWIGSLASDIGKDKIKITTLVKPDQDPHYVEAKPSMILEVRRADLLMFNGLELEIGYLPVLVESSRNPMIQPGTPGYFDCSQFIEAIERPAVVSRSMGDVHPLGNPHYHLSPKNIYRVTGGITELLATVDPGNAGFYRVNLAAFQEKFKEKEKQWAGYNLKGKKFIAYHKFFEYPANEFGFEIIGYVEPKPGIPPSAGWVERIIELAKRMKPDAILTTPYYGTREVTFLSQKSGVKYIVVPHDVGATPACKDWFSLMGQVLEALQ